MTAVASISTWVRSSISAMTSTQSSPGCSADDFTEGPADLLARSDGLAPVGHVPGHPDDILGLSAGLLQHLRDMLADLSSLVHGHSHAGGKMTIK
jgi:hypothetical protein